MQRYYSNVYWHFTGGPKVDWSTIMMPKEIKNKAKPCIEAVDILKKILTSKKLIAGCTERINKELSTEKFCCVCDIPFKDLIYHAEYYGKVAIGFSATSIHRKFNPVLYMDRGFHSSFYSGNLKQFIKLTRFSENPEETFYREREWRSIEGDFYFIQSDIEAIIVPEQYFYEIKEYISMLGFNKDIPIIPFEFIEKA